ncbi:hypothetical protein CDD83_334 [Cordyceps sp. RAO-2017]|nr:hypothetical protein CDD83_334 [Cordyceps sp. RAO-2017]
MPWGIQRLNARKSQPNPNIVFIKPLPGPSESVAQGFLERIAAQCVPIMRKHHLHVMSLEEFEPNREFVGRNFNAGEVIQLVLKSPYSGHWLPFEYVQMVMMHELAHCKQMNHSRAFWAVRNGYAAEMHKLWSEGYTGDGIWGRGASLGTGEWERDVMGGDETLPEHLCGGTYRTSGRKRKKAPVLTHKERQERRIRKRFGESGVALGADDETKVKLEQGKKTKAKPRVAKSDRGRQLRAAAALARFEQDKKDKVKVEKTDEDEEDEGNSESGESSEGDGDESAPGASRQTAIDVDGTPLLDSKGRGMVRVCEDEDTGDAEARGELEDLRDVLRKTRIKQEPAEPAQRRQTTTRKATKDASAGQAEATGTGKGKAPRRPSPTPASRKPAGVAAGLVDVAGRAAPSSREGRATDGTKAGGPSAEEQEGRGRRRCSACSFVNTGSGATCDVCANVLEPGKAPGTWWRCGAATCAASRYVNSGDCGVCGLCGRRRTAAAAGGS